MELPRPIVTAPGTLGLMATVPEALRLMATVPEDPQAGDHCPRDPRQLNPLSQLPDCSRIAIDSLKVCDQALNLLRTFWSYPATLWPGCYK